MSIVGASRGAAGATEAPRPAAGPRGRPATAYVARRNATPAGSWRKKLHGHEKLVASFRARYSSQRTAAALGELDSVLDSHGAGASVIRTEEDSTQLSPELRELCRLQLQLVSNVVNPGIEEGAVVATVYARIPSSFESGRLELEQIASCGPAAAGSNGRAVIEGMQMDKGTILLGATSPASTEAGLISQEWITLPDSSSVVMPLSWGPFLVGLVLVKRSHLGLPPPAPSLSEGHSLDDSFGAKGDVVQELFDESEKQLLLQVARSISIGCVLDQKVVLLQAQAKQEKEHVRTLVEDAKGPLTVLSTLSSLLAPRLPDGEPEQDMANAVVVQSQRLKQVVKQLQDAFSPTPPELTGDVHRGFKYSALPSSSTPPLAEQLARFGAGAVGKQARQSELFPSSSTSSSAKSKQMPMVGGVSGGDEWKGQRRAANCNAVAVVTELLTSAAGVCEATGVDIAVGKGLQSYQARAASGADGNSPTSIAKPVRPLQVAAEPAVVRSAVSQVLDSAFQRTPRGGVVQVDAAPGSDGDVYIWVRDSGLAIGDSVGDGSGNTTLADIKDQDAASALQRMKSGQPPGLGLIGIKIASSLLSEVGGTIDIDTQDQGTTVCVRLPAPDTN